MMNEMLVPQTFDCLVAVPIYKFLVIQLIGVMCYHLHYYYYYALSTYQVPGIRFGDTYIWLVFIIIEEVVTI